MKTLVLHPVIVHSHRGHLLQATHTHTKKTPPMSYKLCSVCMFTIITNLVWCNSVLTSANLHYTDKTAAPNFVKRHPIVVETFYSKPQTSRWHEENWKITKVIRIQQVIRQLLNNCSPVHTAKIAQTQFMVFGCLCTLLTAIHHNLRHVLCSRHLKWYSRHLPFLLNWGGPAVHYNSQLQVLLSREQVTEAFPGAVCSVWACLHRQR